MPESEINDPGVRETAEGTVIQFKKRSQQLLEIADEVQCMLERFGDDNGVIMSRDDARRIDRWMEQIGIIGEELKRAGK